MIMNMIFAGLFVAMMVGFTFLLSRHFEYFVSTQF